MRRFLQFSPAGACLLLIVLLALSPSHSPLTDAGRAADQPATRNPYTETIPGSEVKFDMIPIPGGSFQMGSPETEAGRLPDEGPVHHVSIRPFWMGKCEVTWDEYDLFRGTIAGDKADQRAAEKKGDQKEIDALSRPTPPYSDETFGHGREHQPVLAITHHAAMEYCHWLSGKTGKIYRLPTEAEWEWAARAGTRTAYFFGDDPKQLGDYAWLADNSEENPHPVGEKKPNPWGLYDIYGNVSEWCLDPYRKDFYATCPLDKPLLEPLCPLVPDRFPDVTRGGSWADKPPRLRSAARRSSDKSWIRQDPQRPQSIWWLTNGDFVGFRLLRPVEEVDALKGVRSKVKWESK
jgi:formylglycine-generating enzyme required for sulfatase activity